MRREVHKDARSPDTEHRTHSGASGLIRREVCRKIAHRMLSTGLTPVRPVPCQKIVQSSALALTSTKRAHSRSPTSGAERPVPPKMIVLHIWLFLLFCESEHDDYTTSHTMISSIYAYSFYFKFANELIFVMTHPLLYCSNFLHSHM